MRTDGIGPIQAHQPASTVARPATTDFKSFVTSALEEVSRLQTSADEAAVRLATGEARDLHEVMIMTEQANLALQLTLQVRNKVLDAYQEIMRMQV